MILNWQGWFKVIVWKCTARCIFVETKTPSVGGHQSSEQFYFRGHQITLDLPQISTMLSSSFVLFFTKVRTQLQLYAFYFLTMLISAFFPSRKCTHSLASLSKSADHLSRYPLATGLCVARLACFTQHHYRPWKFISADRLQNRLWREKNPQNQIRDDFVCLSLLVFSWTVGGPSNCPQQLLPVSLNMFCSPMGVCFSCCNFAQYFVFNFPA